MLGIKSNTQINWIMFFSIWAAGFAMKDVVRRKSLFRRVVQF